MGLRARLAQTLAVKILCRDQFQWLKLSVPVPLVLVRVAVIRRPLTMMEIVPLTSNSGL
jgi:hypothetical protein